MEYLCVRESVKCVGGDGEEREKESRGEREMYL